MAVDVLTTTHEVTNQPPPLADYDIFSANVPLVEALEREGGGWARERCSEVGRIWGGEPQEWGRLANENPPKLRTHDRYGNRIDEVEFHPSWHKLLDVAVSEGLAGAPWAEEKPRRRWLEERGRAPGDGRLSQ